jgi:hypothetical protein
MCVWRENTEWRPGSIQDYREDDDYDNNDDDDSDDYDDDLFLTVWLPARLPVFLFQYRKLHVETS